MKRKVVRVLAVMAVVAAGSAVASTPAAASDGPGDICVTNQATWLRDQPWGDVLRTLSPGRGFRVHSIYGGSDIQTWYYGHGAEAPGQDGWIPAANCSW
ncbi:hypothetical protein DER29_6313 [Micromonospora sp. M71_S20]|uniref:hypothetical protein n=1 Tax=Micromonospora sp. M71_S20 TaxID=592872 RepID=UPI000EB34061|nr:hypothetical protein [Micromonospora sp. M71_S20]RLK09751.1 hypothetical protein DER29_6313 [Micromonospora sp. M71_S20]